MQSTSLAMDPRNILLVLVAASLTLSAGMARPLADTQTETSRLPRRARPPDPERTPTVPELKFECCSHGWTECCNTSYLTNTNSVLNQEVQQCLVNAQINNHVITINLLDRPEEVGDDQETENEGEVEEEPICLLNKAAKSEARDHYCMYLGLIDAILELHTLVKMKSLVPCVQYDSNTDYLTPDEILTGITKWHHDMTNTNRCCQFLSDFSAWRPPTVTTLPVFNHHSIRCDPSAATQEWSLHLTTVMDMMHMFNLVDSLSRRRTCLRGCVNAQEVACCNLLPFERGI